MTYQRISTNDQEICLERQLEEVQALIQQLTVVSAKLTKAADEAVIHLRSISETSRRA